MPKALREFSRPPNDNGRGLHGSASIGWSGGPQGYDYWVSALVEMGIKWFKVLDDRGDSLPFCEKLIAAEIFPIVRIIRKDPPPNDVPEPNPGHITAAEEETIKRLIAAGVRYFETNNEPNLASEWKHNAIPADAAEAAKLVALNWLFDARLILQAGGYPGLPAISGGGDFDLMGALVALGRQDILSEGCWIAIHNYALNRPLGYPDDPVNRTGQPLAPEQYHLGAYTPWAWWNDAEGCVDLLETVNEERDMCKNPGDTILQDHSCFREFEYYHHLAVKYLGHSIPIISTEGGVLIGRRQDMRYPRITPDMHRDHTVAMFDFMQRQAPDYYFATTPWLLIHSDNCEMEAWESEFWPRALQAGATDREGIPPMAVPVTEIERLPVIDAVKAMPKIARRLPGAQPAPPAPSRIIVPPSPIPATPPPVPLPAIAASPSPEQLPTVSPEPHSPGMYVVEAGDTLWKIAARFGTTWRAIAVLNEIRDPSSIRPGMELAIPSPALSDAFEQVERIADTQVLPRSPQAAPNGNETSAPPAPESVAPAAPYAPEMSMPEEIAIAAIEPTELPTFIESEPESEPPPAPVQPLYPTPTVRSFTFAYSDMPKPTLDWDPRMDALNVTLEEPPVEPGEAYWKLVRAEYRSPEEANGKHDICYTVLNEHGKPIAHQRVWQGWPEDKTDAATNEQGEAIIPIWASFAPDRHESGPYTAWVDGLPSDRVCGMGMPFKRAVSFVLTWQRVIC